MTRPPVDEAVAWERFNRHIKTCPGCVRSDASGVLCAEGEALKDLWAAADQYAARLADTDATGFSLDDEYPAGLA